jgi:hypothetical protein
MTPLDWTLAGIGSLILVAGAVLMVVDIVRIQWGRESYSHMMKRWGQQYPLVPFGFGLAVGTVGGLLAGHWWWATH